MHCEPGKYSTFHYYFQVVSGSAGKGLVIICHSDTIGILTVYTKSENIIHTVFFSAFVSVDKMMNSVLLGIWLRVGHSSKTQTCLLLSYHS